MPHSNQFEIINIMGLHIGSLQPILTSSACVQLNMKQFSSKTFFKLKANLNSTYKISLKISGKIDDSKKDGNSIIHRKWNYWAITCLNPIILSNHQPFLFLGLNSCLTISKQDNFLPISKHKQRVYIFAHSSQIKGA